MLEDEEYGADEKDQAGEDSKQCQVMPLELGTINKLYLELSQIATAKTARQIELEELLRSAHCIAERQGKDTAWERFAASIKKVGIGSVTPRTYRVLTDDEA